MSAPVAAPGFAHAALLYGNEDEFLAGTVPFIREGLARDESILVVVDEGKIDLLRAALGPRADRVDFADMAVVGRNPARIIPRWQRFLDDCRSAGRSARGIGEPLWPGRGPAEVVECQTHEALLNVAFADGPPWPLLCPYDVAGLDARVVAEARRSHPTVITDGVREDSADYRDGAAPLDHPLPPPPPAAAVVRFGPDPGSLSSTRSFVRRHAVELGGDGGTVDRLVLAVNELVTNSTVHGAGGGVLRLWRDGDTLLCEVRDGGRFVAHPLIGRRLPAPDVPGGRGLWLVNQLCDLLELRVASSGTTLRVHHRLT
ncbi:anti-sigma factor RsbA family regulatory protein [Saccharothrix isguenensis]